ncbi:MAG: pyridoxal phosphate-dependent aminotransferase [Candidatus Omnitrophica bacterium]|nr:pyridoxal phosphate-dependent aminotransferase [Candidatus Omnitrophota bacterium]
MLAQRIQAVKPSATLKITALARQLKAQGKKVINLAAGEPDFDTPASVKEAAIAAIREGFTKYTPTSGIPQLKEAVAEVFQRELGVRYRPEQVVVTCGAKQALYNLLQVLIEPGDEVLIPSHYWVSYPEMVRLSGGTPVEVRTDPKEGFRLKADQIERAITPRSRVLILNSPANPTGAVLDEGRLKEIARVAVLRGLWIVSDEIYCRLVYGVPHVSIASVSPEAFARTLLVDGVSKSYAMTGWRIGYFAGPPEVVEAAERLQDHSTSNPSSISQRAALAALTGDQICLSEMSAEFGRRRDFLLQRVLRIPKISLIEPEGAFYAFLNISGTGLTSGDFSNRLLESAHVALIPGEGFGWDDHVRVSFAASQEELREGFDRLERWIRSL